MQLHIANINLNDPPDNVVDIQFIVPTYETGALFPIRVYGPEPCTEFGSVHDAEAGSYVPKLNWEAGPCLNTVLVPRRGPAVQMTDAPVSYLFKISEWRASIFVAGQPNSLTVQIGNSQSTVQRNARELLIDGLPKGSHSFSITIHGGLTSGTTPLPVKIPGLLPFVVA